MQVQKIKEIIAHYKTYLLGKNSREHLYLYDILQNFQDHWSLAKDPLHDMINHSIGSQESRTLWKRANYDPKERMVKFAQINPDFVAQMFRTAFDEDKSIDRRVDRWFFYAEQMLQELRRTNPTSVVNNHFQDHSMLSLYLACAYPEKYAYYDKRCFIETLRVTKANNFQTIDDLPRYFKMLNTFDVFMKKDPEIFAAHLMRLDGDHFYKGYTRMMITEALFVFFANSEKKEVRD